MQKPKGKKRPKVWHRGRHGSNYGKAMRRWPDLTTGADPTSGVPTPLRSNGSNRGAVNRDA